MKQNICKKVVSYGMAALLMTSFVPMQTNAAPNPAGGIHYAVDTALLKGNPTAQGQITIDNNLNDWSKVTQRASTVSGIDSWKIAISADYETLYLSYQGTSSSEWDYNYLGTNRVQITYANGAQGRNNQIQFTGWQNSASAKDGWWADIAGADTTSVNNAHGNTAGPYIVESAIPMSFFENEDFTLTFAGTEVSSKQIEVLAGQEIEEPTQEAVYTGITIDGSFTDWAAVEKHEAGCPNDAHKDCIDQTAVVFDGDYVYLYVRDSAASGSTAAGAGTHGNGLFSITTDLGLETLIQLNRDGTVNGIDGATCSHVGREWEIAIPERALQNYRESISFGLYQLEPFVTGVTNLHPENVTSDRKQKEFTGDIQYDGVYGDWDNYPHTRIQYATAGTQRDVVDSNGALYSNGSTLFGHVVTEMPEHTLGGGEGFTTGVTILFNNDWNTAFYPRLALVDGSGNINWDPQLNNLPDGTYEFYIFSIDAWHTSSNLNNLNDMDQWYGKMTMTLSATKNECEYYLDLEKIADKFHCDASDFKRIDAQYKRLGLEWVTTAGASSGAWLGLLICIGVCAGVYVYRKKKGEDIQQAQ